MITLTALALIATPIAKTPPTERYLQCVADEAKALEPSGESVDLIYEAVVAACSQHFDKAVEASAAETVAESTDRTVKRDFENDPAFRAALLREAGKVEKETARGLVVRLVLSLRAKTRR